MNTQKITVQTNVATDLKKAWDYYTQPQHITKWNFASEEWCCPKAENDLRVGGKYFTRMEAIDGSFGFDFEGYYTEIIPEKLLEYTLTDGRTVRVNFHPRDAEVLVEVSFDPDLENELDLQKQGWQAILDNYKKQVVQ